MKQFGIVTMCCVILVTISGGQEVDLSFPENLTIGASSSAYQIEGAWNFGGESICDRWIHTNPASILDGSNGDIACNSYYKYKEDVQLIKSLGLDFYRFSISWTRILPTGFTNVVSEDGLQYYKNLTAELVANGIEPIATMYHFDHPQVMEDMGGWTNELMVDWFVSYARILFKALGDKVKIWTTINEPETLCPFGYDTDLTKIAPGKELNGVGVYLCGHNILKAHAKTYRMYDEEFRATQQGQIGISQACQANIAANSSDTVSAETAFQFTCGWMGHPIYIGDYPEIMKTRLAMISKSQGYPKSRLPELSKEWISIIKGTADFLGLNHYTSLLVSPDPDEQLGIFNSDVGLIESIDPSWPHTSSLAWLYDYPSGFGYLLRKIRDEYNNPPIRIMENGYADLGELDDYDRINFHHGYVKELLTAIKRDGCNVQSYGIWSLMDSYEWNSGYIPKFGIHSVNFDDPDRTRSEKLSTSWWRTVLTTRKLQPVPVHDICDEKFNCTSNSGSTSHHQGLPSFSMYYSLCTIIIILIAQDFEEIYS